MVIDPVMVSESGATLLDADARGALIERLFPRATAVTPNLPEARALAGIDTDDAEVLARAIHALGPQIVIVTGGHREQAADLFFDGTAGRGDPRAPSPRRRGPRLGLHALVGARGPAGPRATPRCRPRGPPGRWPPRPSATVCARSGRGRDRSISWLHGPPGPACRDPGPGVT